MFPKSQAQKDLADWRVKATDPMCVADPQSALIASNILATTLADFHADHEAVYVWQSHSQLTRQLLVLRADARRSRSAPSPLRL